MARLDGKVALVTGAAHRVGRGIALALAAAGAHVAVHYHTSGAAAAATVADLQALGVRAFAAQADQSDPAQAAGLIDAVLARFGRLDILVNSAAIMEPGDVLTLTPEAWDRSLAVNLRGPFLCAQRAARAMLAAGGGAIVNIADLAGLEPWTRYPQLSVSKAGVIMLTRVLARALAPTVRVNAVAPGPVAAPQGWNDARWRAVWEHTPLRREGTPTDVGAAVVYLAGAPYVTGVILPVDGGTLLQ